jgi:predicted TIM-barrel fold metal-dependent hydrolase
MDANGIGFQVISHVAPAAQGLALLDALPLAPADKAKIAGGKAERVLRLKGT